LKTAGLRVNALAPVRFVGFSGLRLCVNIAVMKAVFHQMAEEKKKFYRCGLLEIKIEIVYIYIGSQSCRVGVQGGSSARFHSDLSRGMDGRRDGREQNRDNGGFKMGFL
jgi:hypothetical protein